MIPCLMEWIIMKKNDSELSSSEKKRIDAIVNRHFDYIDKFEKFYSKEHKTKKSETRDISLPDTEDEYSFEE